MRLSSLQTFLTGTTQIVDLTSQVNRTQEQISRGTKILTPADDPVASNQILKLKQENVIRDQHMSNITLLTSRLELEESVLNSASENLIRVRELTIRANDGALTTDDRKAVVSELKVRLNELADLMNTRDASNEYLFSGFRGSTKPFVDNGSGNYSYAGDEGQRLLKIAASTFLPANDSGKEAFVDVKSAQSTFQTFNNPNNRANPAASISTGFVSNQTEFDKHAQEDYIIVFNNPDDMALIGKPSQANFDIVQKSDGRVVKSNMEFDSGVAFEFNGMMLTIEGNPSVGDKFHVESKETQGILTTVSRLVDGMETLTLSDSDEEKYKALIADTLNNLENAQTSVLEIRSEIGARLNTIKSTKALHEEVEIVSKQLLSSLQDLDYAEAVSQLSFESFVLEAAQKSYAKISGLSLFNSI